MRLQLERFNSPAGRLLLVADEKQNMCALEFADHEPRLRRHLEVQYTGAKVEESPIPKSIRGKIESYFQGDIEALNQIPVAARGTPFQLQVWKSLRAIPAGETTTYGRLAAKIGRPSASRAVGAANGANPIAIVVPCHRVIGASGSLTGYASGLAHKQWLLTHESEHSRALIASA